MFDNEYISLASIAARIGLSKKYLREQVRIGKIPYLTVSGRKRFQEKNVRAALERLEQTAKRQGKHVLSGELQ